MAPFLQPPSLKCRTQWNLPSAARGARMGRLRPGRMRGMMRRLWRAVVDAGFGGVAVWIESFVFPVLFGYYAVRSGLVLYDKREMLLAASQRLMQGAGGVGSVFALSYGMYHAVLILLNALIAWTLVIRRNLRHKPEGFAEIVVPLIGTFFYLLYSVVPVLPARGNVALVAGLELLDSLKKQAGLLLPNWFLSLNS